MVWVLAKLQYTCLLDWPHKTAWVCLNVQLLVLIINQLRRGTEKQKKQEKLCMHLMRACRSQTCLWGHIRCEEPEQASIDTSTC